MKNSTHKSNLKIAVGPAIFRAWSDYDYHLKKMGIKTIKVDFFHPDWATRLAKIDPKVDAFIWHSDTWESNYRKIHDRVYFVEKFLNKPIFPDLNMYYTYNDKIKQYEIFKYLKLPLIPTYIAFTREKALEIYKKNKKYPIVSKDPFGAIGSGVNLVKTKKDLKKLIEKTFPKSYAGESRFIYLQEFIPNIKKDLRIITIGNKVAIAYWRVGKKGEWRHNVCRGAHIDFNNIPQNALDFCLDISKKQKFHWMSYDILITKNGKLKLIEWSCNFGVKGPREQGIDIRKMQAQYLVKYLKKRQ